MTENDKALISQAEALPRLEYFKIDPMIKQADTLLARLRLYNIRQELYDLCVETC